MIGIITSDFVKSKNTNVRFLVVDGLYETREQYIELIRQVDKNADIIESISAEDAFVTLFEREIDLIVTSEILSFRNAFALSRVLHKANINVPVIVLANDGSNAVEAIKSNVFEYLIKPLPDRKFIEAIKTAIEAIENKLSKKKKSFKANVMLRISTTKGYKLVDLDELAYCLADGSYSNICFTDGTVNFSSYYLGKIEKILDEYHFTRINRSAIVNLKLIRLIDKQKEICQLNVGGQIKEFRITKSNLKKLEAENIL